MSSIDLQQNSTDHGSLLIVGAGQLGRALLGSFGKRQRSKLLALTRSEESAASLRAEGLEARAADLARGGGDTAADWIEMADAVVFCAAPSGDATRDEVYRSIPEHLVERMSPSSHLVLVSSTGVYAEREGGWVDEAAPLSSSERARPLIAGEDVARSKGATVLRCSGLVGRRRGPHRRALSGPQLDRWLNLVWMADVVRALRWSLEERSDGCFNVSALPVRRRQFYENLSQERGRSPHQNQEELTWSPDASEGYRVDTTKLRQLSGVEPRAVTASDLVSFSCGD